MSTAALTEIVPPPADEPAPRPIDGLLAALRAGIDRQANERRLFDRYYRLICHFFRRRGCTTDEAEDLSQETFLRIFDGLSSYRGEARLETWMLRIAENVLMQKVRRASSAKRNAQETSLDSLDGEGPEPSGEDTKTLPAEPLRRLLGKEQARALLAALDELPPQMEQCLRLRFIQELSYREIARALQLSIDSVKVQLHRGRRRLRERLAGTFDHPTGGER